MSFKKMGLWKLLTVSTVTVCFASILAATPIVTIGYLMGNNSSGDGTGGPNNNNNSHEDNNDGVDDQINGGSGGGAGDNTGGTGDSTSGENPQFKTIELNQKTENNPLHIVGSFKQLISSSGEQSEGLNNELLEKNLSNIIKSKYMDKLIQNYNDVKDGIDQIYIKLLNDNNKEPWGNDHTWVSGESAPNIIVYFQESEQFSVNSVIDLKEKLLGNNNEKLKQIMDNALKDAPNRVEYSSYEFANGSALVPDENGDYLRIHVKATPPSRLRTASSSDGKENIELRIPTSNIAYAPKDVSVSVTTMQNSQIKGLENAKTYIKYDIGIDPTTHITPSTSNPSNSANSTTPFQKHTLSNGESILKVDLSTENSNIPNVTDGKQSGSVTVDGLAKTLGWYVEPQSNGQRSRSQLTLNNDKIAHDLKIFNATFSNLNVESLDKDQNNQAIVPSNYNYTGKYKITIDATPTTGHYWETGENNTKTITLTHNTSTKNNNEVFLINIADAKFVTSDLYSDYTFDDTNCNGITKPSQSESTITENNNETNGNEFYQFFSQENNIILLEKFLNDELKKANKSSVGVRVIVDKTFNFKNNATDFVNGVCKKNNQVRIKILLSDGHSPTRENSGLGNDNTKSDNIWLKSWGKGQQQ